MEIKGLEYTRTPNIGEEVFCYTSCGSGCYNTVYVKAGDEIIAFENTPSPVTARKEELSIRRKESLAKRAFDHWSSLGFKTFDHRKPRTKK